MKNFFHMKDNIIDKKLTELIDRQQFASRKLVNDQINELIDFFALHFADGSKDVAHDLLDKHNAPMRKKDAMLISYFAGILTIILFSLIILIIMPQSGEIFSRPGAAQEIFSSLYTFRFLLMILFTIGSTAFAIKILRAYKVNYLFIFELDPHYKVGFMQLLRVSNH